MAVRQGLRVLYVNPGVSQHGGAERSLLGLVRGLDEYGVNSRIIVFGEGDLAALLRSEGREVGVVSVDRKFTAASRYRGLPTLLAAGATAIPVLWRTMREVRKHVREFDADVVHTNGMRAHLIAPFLAPNGAARIISLRDLPQSAGERKVVSTIARRVDAVIANSDLVASEYQLALNGHVIDNPVVPPIRRDPSASRIKYGVPRDAFVVVHLGHFHWWKGHLDLVRAFSALDSQCHLLLAGGALYGEASAAYLDEVTRAAARSAAHERIHYIGVQDDVSWLYGAADIVAHCSIRPEPFGRTIIEALLTGKAVVASAAGTPGKMLTDGSTAILYPPADVPSLERALILLRNNDVLRKEIGTRGNQWAGARFAPEKHAAAMMSVYTTLQKRCGGIAGGQHPGVATGDR